MAQGQACNDLTIGRVLFPLNIMKYLILSLSHFGNEAKRGDEICVSTRNAFKNQQKVGNGSR